jgi:hypothetical protein
MAVGQVLSSDTFGARFSRNARIRALASSSAATTENIRLSYGAEEGQALGLSHYLAEPGDGLPKGIEIALRAAANPQLSNFAIIHALPRAARADPETGLLLVRPVSIISIMRGTPISRGTRTEAPPPTKIPLPPSDLRYDEVGDVFGRVGVGRECRGPLN